MLVKRGFTLIELVIVVMLIAIASAVVAPRMVDMVGGARTRKAARDFCNLARLARASAANELKPYALTMNVEERLVSVAPAEDKGGTPASLFKRGLPDGVSLRIDRGGEDKAAIVFKPDGSAEDGEVSFVDRTGRVIRVAVDGISGKARVVRE